MLETELAWAAGFFDGEGTTGLAKGTDSIIRRKPRLSVPQKHRECLERFQKAVGGLGKIYPVNHGQIHHFSVQNAKGVDTVLTLLWPYLSCHKKQQAENAGFKFGVIRNPKTGRPRRSRENTGI